jgi:hypothetical protein
MNDLAKAWLEALESDDYEQGTGALRVCDQYCCLGVACDLGEKQGILTSIVSAADKVYAYTDAGGINESGVLPPGMWQALGLREPNPDFLINDLDPHFLHTRASQRFALTELNDSQKFTFRQIAYVIRNHPEMFTDYKENPA